MKKHFLCRLLAAVLLCASVTACGASAFFLPCRLVAKAALTTVISKLSIPNMSEIEAIPALTIQVGAHSFTATLEDSPTTRALVDRLPITVSMGELNGNEKFYFMDEPLPTNAISPAAIETGDLMLYGDDCLVLFYERFPTSYRYTPLGRVDDPAGLSAALGRGAVEVTFRV